MISSQPSTLITGASSGIGFELAHVFAQHQHNLILVARSEGKLQALKSDLESKYSISVIVSPMDLSLPDAARTLFQNLKHHPVDILVNNAGFGAHGLFAELDFKNQSEMIRVNILALMELTHLFLPQMLKRKNGRILNVASTAAFQPGPLMSVYYATKAFVLSFSEGIAEELKNSGVTVTVLCPGPTESAFMDTANFRGVALLETMKMPTSLEVARYGYEALMTQKTIAVHGTRNRLLMFANRLAPRSAIRQIVHRLQKKRSISQMS